MVTSKRSQMPIEEKLTKIKKTKECLHTVVMVMEMQMIHTLRTTGASLL